MFSKTGKTRKGQFFFEADALFTFVDLGVVSQLPHHCLYVYRTYGCLVYGLWLWGLDVYIWVRALVPFSTIVARSEKLDNSIPK